MSKQITMPFPPSANRYWRHSGGMTYVSQAAKDYKRTVGYLFGSMKPVSGSVLLIADFYRPRKAGDLDNSLKVLIDSLRGLAYDDDKQIIEIRARRFDDKQNPRAEVTIEELGDEETNAR